MNNLKLMKRFLLLISIFWTFSIDVHATPEIDVIIQQLSSEDVKQVQEAAKKLSDLAPKIDPDTQNKIQSIYEKWNNSINGKTSVSEGEDAEYRGMLAAREALIGVIFKIAPRRQIFFRLFIKEFNRSFPEFKRPRVG